MSPDPGSGQLTQSSPLLQPTIGANGQLVAPTVARLQPQYVLAHLPGSTRQSFMLLTPFVPVASTTERQNLTAYMTASSDPADYGALPRLSDPLRPNR